MVEPTIIAAGILHALSRKLLLWKLLWDQSCRGVSLISQELLLVVYLARSLDLLYLFESLGTELIKVVHLAVALAIVLLIRYSPKVAETYDEELDSVPRAAILIPPLVLAITFHRVLLIMEVLHQFSRYLEAIVLIPQFVLLYRRQKYDTWVLLFTIMVGAEGIVHNMPLLLDWQAQQASNPYDLCAAVCQAAVYIAGLAALGIRHVETARQQGLNDGANKPAFDEVWEAGKFEFQEPGGAAAAGAVHVKAKEGP